MPPPWLRLLVLLVPAVLLTLSPTVSTTKATMNTEGLPSDFEVNNTTSTSTTAVLRTQAAREFAADPRAPQDKLSRELTSSPASHQSTLFVNTSSTEKRKRPLRIRLIKVYKKVWRSPKRKNSSLDPTSGNATKASNRTISRKQPASITVIELPLKPLPDEEKIENIMQLHQSSFSLNNSSNDKISKENVNERNGNPNTLAESLDSGGDIKERRSFGNESFERTQPPSGVQKEVLVPSSEMQGYSDKKSGKSMSYASDMKNSQPNPSYPSETGKNENSDEEYTEVSRENKNNLQRNKHISSGVVERFLDIQSEEIQDLNQNPTQSKIPKHNMRNESNEHTINEHNTSTSDENTVRQDLNCTTDKNPSDTPLPITSCQYGSTPNQNEKTTQSSITLHDDEPLNGFRHGASTGVPARKSTSKNSSNSNTTNGLNKVEETEIENEDSALASGKQHAELINESDITTELSSKEITEVLARAITIPVGDIPSKENHRDSINGANYFTEIGENHRGMPEKFDEVNSTAKSSITHSSANFEDSPQVNVSIPKNVPNLQDNLGDSRSTVDNLTANLYASSTIIPIRESTESVLNAIMSGKSYYPDIPTELSSTKRVEEVIERGQFTIPVDDVSTKEQHLDTVNDSKDPEKAEINRSIPEIRITLDDVNSTTEPAIIHSSVYLEDIPHKYDTIPKGMPNLPNNLSDIHSTDISSNISKLSTIILTKERTESILTERNTEESFDSDFKTEISPQGMVEEVMESDQLSIPIDNVSSKEQHQIPINNTNDNSETGKIHRDVPEIFDDGNTTDQSVIDSLRNFEDMPQRYDSIPRNIPILQDSASNTQSTYLDAIRTKSSTTRTMVENTLRQSYNSEITTELSSKETVGKELENSEFLTIVDSKNNREQTETSGKGRAFFLEDTFTSESKTPPQTDKDTNKYEPIDEDTIRQDPLISSFSINEFSSLTQPESSTSLLIGEHKGLENKTFTYPYMNTDFSSEENEEKELFTTSDVDTRKDKHGSANNEEKINTEYPLGNSTRETDFPNTSRVLTDVQNEYKETLRQLNPLDKTHFTNENSSAINSESSATSSMEISPTKNRQLIYLENLTNNENVSPEDVIEFTEMPLVSVTSETSMSPIKEDDTTPEIQRYSNTESTSYFNSAVFANVFKKTEYPTSNMEHNRNEEDRDELPSWTPSQNVSKDFTENSVKFLPEESTEFVTLNDVTQEHTEQSMTMQTENQPHPSDFYRFTVPLTSEIASEISNELLNQVENKNYSGRDMRTLVTEVMSDPLFSENNLESRKVVKYSELTQIPTPPADKNFNSEVTQGRVSSDRLKITHKSIYLNEEPMRSFLQKETNVYNTPNLLQTRKHNYEPINSNNQLLISAIKTKSIPTAKVGMCQTPPSTSKAPKIKHSRIHTSLQDLSKMKNVERDEVRRVLSKMVPIDKTFYQNFLQASSLVNAPAPYKQATQQNNKEPPLKYIPKKKSERTSFSTGKHEIYSRDNIPRINSNCRPSLSPITLPPATSKKQLSTRTYSSSYPACFCPLEDRLVTNGGPKTNSQVVSFYNRRIQSHDQQSGTGELHTGRSQSPTFKSLIKQRLPNAPPYSKPLSKTYYSAFSRDFMEDGVPDSAYEALIKEVENTPRPFDVFDFDYDDSDPITSQNKPTLQMSEAFHPRRVAFVTPARHHGRRDLPKGARTSLGRSLVRSVSLPIHQATKTDLFPTYYCIPATISDPLPDSLVPSLVRTSFPNLFPTPLLEPALAFTPTPNPPLFIANSLVRLRSPGYSILDYIPAVAPSPMHASLSEFGAFPAPFTASVLNPILIPPAVSIPASDPAPACNMGLVPSLPGPILNPIPDLAPDPFLYSVLARTILNPILDSTIPYPILAHFLAPNLDPILANTFTPPSVPTSDPFMSVLSSTSTSIISYLSQYMPRTSCEVQKNWFWLEKLLLLYPELASVLAPASFVAPAQASAVDPAPSPALDPASAPAHVFALESAPDDMASLDKYRRGLWRDGDPWYFTFKDKSSTTPIYILPSDPPLIPPSPWLPPSPLSLPPLPLPPPPQSPPRSSSPPPSPTSFPFQPLLTFPSLPTSQRLSPLPQFTPSQPPPLPLVITSQPFPPPPPPPSTPSLLTPQKRRPRPPSPSPQSRTPPLPLQTFLSKPLQTPPLPPSPLIKFRSYAPILPPPPLALQTKTPTLPPAPLLPKFELSISSSIPLALSAPQLSRTPPLPLLAFLSIPLQTPPPASLIKLRSHAPILLPLHLTLQTKSPTLPPAPLVPELESSTSSSIPLALSSVPPSPWLPLPLLLLYSSQSPPLQLPLPFPPPVSLPSDQPVGVNPCMRSLQKWYARISLHAGPDVSRSQQTR